MSELKAYIGPAPDEKGLADYYLKSEADKVIAEKDAEIERLEAMRKVHVEAIASMEDRLHQDEKKIRRLRRALWLTRSRRAFAEAKYNNQIAIRYRQHKEMTIAECYDKEVIKWKKADSKCRAKAEEYK